MLSNKQLKQEIHYKEYRKYQKYKNIIQIYLFLRKLASITLCNILGSIINIGLNVKV